MSSTSESCTTLKSLLMQKMETMATELCKLVIDGDCEGVKALLRSNKEILRGVSPQRNSALHVAAARGHHEMVKLLVEQRPCMLSMPNLNHETPLHTAARSGNPKVIEALLNVDNGLQCNCNSHLFPQRIKVQVIWKAQNSKGETALHYAVKGNHLEVVEQLLAKVKGIELIVNKEGESALFTACDYGCLEIVKRLLSATPSVGDARIRCIEIGISADPAVLYTRNDGTSCLHQAIINILEWRDEGKHNSSWFSQFIDLQQWHDFVVELAFLLLRKRPQLAEAVDPSGNSPLHLLVAIPFANESHLNLVKELLNARPNMNFLLNKDGMAPVHIAARDGNEKVLNCLLDSAPHCSYLLGKDSKNALHFALEHERRLYLEFPYQGNDEAKKTFIEDYVLSVVRKLDCLRQDSVDIGFLLNEPDSEGETALSIVEKKLFKPLKYRADEALLETLKNTVNQFIFDTEGHRMNQGRWGTSTPSPNIFKENKVSKSSQPESEGYKEDVDVTKLGKRFSVIAALIATISFAAAFTIPGGLNQVNGSPLLMHKAALKIFILCDSLAFCLSLLSLYKLIGSPLDASGLTRLVRWVVRKEDASARKKIKKQLFLRAIMYLALSLDATMVAFVTGVYVVVAHKCQWLAVTVCITTVTIPLVDSIWRGLTDTQVFG